MSAGWVRRRRAGRLARVVVVSLAAVAAVIPPSLPAHAAEPVEPVEALLIGDSVLDGLARPYGSSGRDQLSARHSIIVDTAGCRRLIATSCRIRSNLPPPSAITVLRTRAGQYHRAVVIATGYNDETTGAFGIDAAVDAIMAEARRQGIEHVIWLTYREAGTPGNIRRFKASNALLRKRHDRGLVIADWATRSATLPLAWFSADGIHLGSGAVTALAALIGDALDRLPAPRPRAPSRLCSRPGRVNPCLSLVAVPETRLRTRSAPHRPGFRPPAR